MQCAHHLYISVQTSRLIFLKRLVILFTIVCRRNSCNALKKNHNAKYFKQRQWYLGVRELDLGVPL